MRPGEAQGEKTMAEIAKLNGAIAPLTDGSAAKKSARDVRTATPRRNAIGIGRLEPPRNGGRGRSGIGHRPHTGNNR